MDAINLERNKARFMRLKMPFGPACNAMNSSASFAMKELAFMVDHHAFIKAEVLVVYFFDNWVVSVRSGIE